MARDTPRIPPPFSYTPPAENEGGRPLAGSVVLVWGNEDLTVSEGEVLIGRAADCDVVLHDVLVSRHHAKIVVHHDRVVVEDLLSANGVYVNDTRVDRTQPLHDGDRILIATREVSAFATERNPASPAAAMKAPAPPPGALPSGPTQKAVPFQLLGKMVDKFIAAGRVGDAERVIHEHMLRVLEGARAGLSVPKDVCDAAGEQAMKLARASRNPRWIDYAVELHARSRRLMAERVIEHLDAALSQVPGADAKLLKHYLEVLRASSGSMTRQELECLNRLAAASGMPSAPR